ncbi:hypothetical protein ZIOFF_043961 [Zingiber officinale]|uniref:Uncharacterized protein n=1 Tax=Zingiber officinale TaxID=94328 RepID=A0A8J5FVX3_ZINOF|nr:hypothetical protein ZIOFF_043961 [Zingiber officinale]
MPEALEKKNLQTNKQSLNFSVYGTKAISLLTYSEHLVYDDEDPFCLSYEDNSVSCSIEISPHVSITCLIKGCSVIFHMSGSIKISEHANIVAGSVRLVAKNLALDHHATINTTSLGGSPPSQTSGTPIGYDGAGGGHGGRGASCVKSNKTNWGGDVYAWSTLFRPRSYGSKGGSISAENQYGGDGGGCILFNINDTLQLDGSVTAEGGQGGLKGGGGSGGSIIVHAFKLCLYWNPYACEFDIMQAIGKCIIDRKRVVAFTLLDAYLFFCFISCNYFIFSGGFSNGCPENAGAAGTVFDKALESLRVSNDNFTTKTETPLLDFPVSTLWSNVFVESKAKALVPLLWTRVQVPSFYPASILLQICLVSYAFLSMVQALTFESILLFFLFFFHLLKKVRGQIKLIDGGSICFGLMDYPVSEFELVAEELLLSDSVIKVYGAFRMYVKMLLMWDSRIQIDGGGNSEVSTSLLEARNLVVLRHNSVISSNANLGVYGQGLLKLSGRGDEIKAQRLFLSLFYNIEVGSGSLLQAPLDENVESSLVTQSLCESQTCPKELLMPPDDCHVNDSLSLTLQICRVDDLTVSGIIRGSIIHIHRARTVTIDTEGIISASELGCKEGIGKGKFLKYGAGGGAGHGGKGGSGFYNGLLIDGGRKYGDADLPCELGSGSSGSSESLVNVAGGGMIGIFYLLHYFLALCSVGVGAMLLSKFALPNDSC